MQKRKKIIVAVSLLALIITALIIVPTFLVPHQDDDNRDDNGYEEPPLPPYEMVRLNRSPFDLDKFFDEGGSLTPYPNYYHVDHYPCAGKWYMYADDIIPFPFRWIPI